MIRKVIGGELRAYIQWNNHWRHVYIMGSYDQAALVGDPVRMLYFKLTKSSKDILSAEKIKFHKKKPIVQTKKRSVES